MKKWNGKKKALTFSFDDGVAQDLRVIEILDKYSLKATFNLNSARLGRKGTLERNGIVVDFSMISCDSVKSAYKSHEVAAHTLTHPFLPDAKDEGEIIRQVEADRLALSELVGYEVVGFAYPGGGVNFNRRISEIIRANTGIKYCRHTLSSHSFVRQENLFEFSPTVYHHREWDMLFSLGEKFLTLPEKSDAVFYVWGHAYEFDIHNTWDRFEEFLRMMSGHSDIFYGTNKEVLL